MNSVRDVMLRVAERRNTGEVLAKGDVDFNSMPYAAIVDHDTGDRARWENNPGRLKYIIVKLDNDAGVITAWESPIESISPDLEVGDNVILVITGNKSAVWMKVSSLCKPYPVPKIGKDEILVAIVGTEEHPATQSDIDGVQLALATAMKANITLVTHHAVRFVVLKRNRFVVLKRKHLESVACLNHLALKGEGQKGGIPA